MSSATYYTPAAHARLADGSLPSRQGGYCALRGVPFGSRVLVTTRGGRRVVVTCRDRGNLSPGTIDLDRRSFEALAGPRYKIIGRLRVRWRVVRAGRRGRG